MYVIDRILNSNTTIIGHDTRNEIVVEKLLNLIPGVVFIGKDDRISTDDALEYFNSTSYVRNYKLSMLNNESIYIVVYINNISLEKDSELSRSVLIKRFVKTIQSQIYTLRTNDVKINLILVSGIYTSITPSGQSISFRSPDTLLYECDVAIQLVGDRLSIVKDRNEEEKNFNIKSELREVLINSILDESRTY